MRIALDAFEAGFEPLTGTGRYVRALLAELPRESLTAFCRRGSAVAGGTPMWCLLNRTVWSQVRLPLALTRRRFDVVHIPGPRVPWFVRGRLVATIHDLAFLKFPAMFRPAHRRRLEWFTRQAIRRSNRLIAVSASTKQDLVELLNAKPECVDVVYHGVDHNMFRADVAPDVRSVPYVLSVGALQPRKNFMMLTRAFNRLCERRREPVELLIAGQRGWMWEEIEEEAKKSPFAERIRLLGYVEDKALPSLYAGATLVAMPSLYEGFGLPLLEAMACGAAVVASNASCFPEIVGDAAVMLDPLDEEVWTNTLDELLDNPARREALRIKGLERARTFTWERTAQQTLSVYRKATGR